MGAISKEDGMISLRIAYDGWVCTVSIEEKLNRLQRMGPAATSSVINKLSVGAINLHEAYENAALSVRIQNPDSERPVTVIDVMMTPDQVGGVDISGVGQARPRDLKIRRFVKEDVWGVASSSSRATRFGVDMTRPAFETLLRRDMQGTGHDRALATRKLMTRLLDRAEEAHREGAGKLESARFAEKAGPVSVSGERCVDKAAGVLIDTYTGVVRGDPFKSISRADAAAVAKRTPPGQKRNKAVGSDPRIAEAARRKAAVRDAEDAVILSDPPRKKPQRRTLDIRV